MGQIGNDVFDGRHHRQGCTAITGLAQTLNAPRVDEIAIIFCQSALHRRFQSDEFQLEGDFDVFMQYPILKCRFHVQFESCGCRRDVDRVLLNNVPSKSASTTEPDNTVAAFHSPFLSALFVALIFKPKTFAQSRVRDENYFRSAGRGNFVGTFCQCAAH
jgi:hypothetical protein